MAKNCWDIILSSSPEIVAHLKKQSGGIDYNPTTKEGRDEYIKAARELQQHSIDTINDIYSEIGIEGFKKTEKVQPLVENKLLNLIRNNEGVSDAEKSNDLQYFIDKAGENPVAFENIHGKEITDKLLEQVPTDKLIENFKFVAKVNDESPIAKRLDEIIGERESKQQATIESAVIEINGKQYEGKNHAEAILKAKEDGQNISNVNRQADGKFKLSDGTIIDRAEAKTKFGQDRSELLIPQDEAADQANKDYSKLNVENKKSVPVDVSTVEGKVNFEDRISGIKEATNKLNKFVKNKDFDRVEGKRLEDDIYSKVKELQSDIEKFKNVAKENDISVYDNEAISKSLDNDIAIAENELKAAKDKLQGFKPNTNVVGSYQNPEARYTIGGINRKRQNEKIKVINDRLRNLQQIKRTVDKNISSKDIVEDLIGKYSDKGLGMSPYAPPDAISAAYYIKEKAGENFRVGEDLNKLSTEFLNTKSQLSPKEIKSDKGIVVEEIPKKPKKSKLSDDEWATVNSDEFIEWSNDWKDVVMGKNGEPLKLYHATNADFEQFDISKARGKGYSRIGFWFGSDQEVTSQYGRKMRPSFLKITDFDEFGSWAELEQNIDVRGKTFGKESEEYREYLKKQNVDGVVIKNAEIDDGGKQDIYLVLEPNQIWETSRKPKSKELGENAPPKPPIDNAQEETKKEEPKKIRAVYKNIINRSKLTPEQKELLRNDPNALYTVLPNATAKQIALDIINDMGVEAAVAEASRKNSELEPVERVMVLGAAMDYYAGLGKQAAAINNETGIKNNADLELDANEKMQEVAKELGGLGTAYGRAINIFNEIYKLSNLALERKLKKTVDEVNKLRNSKATEDAKVVENILKDGKNINGIGAEMSEAELQREANSKKKISDLEKEIEDLRKQIKTVTNTKTGTKSNPLKINRVTNDTEYDKRVKEFKSRVRTGINKDDLSDLTYFGLYHLENGLTKFADWIKVMSSKFGGFTEYLKGIYSNVRQETIQKGADKNLFDSDEIVDNEFQKLQDDTDAKKLAVLSKRVMEAKLNPITDADLTENQERLLKAKLKVVSNIKKVREIILNKEREIKKLNKPLNEDLELQRLKDDEADLTDLLDNYLPKEEDKYKVQKSRERIKDRLTKDIISLNEQINAGEKNVSKSKPDFSNDKELNRLKELKKQKQDILNMVAASPDKARIAAPRLAAERIRKDAAVNLDLSTTKNEQTYLKKLINVVQNKAREYYKEKKENVKNVNDWLQFAIANGKADYAIWERTQDEVESQIDADEKLTDEQKQDVKDFLTDYQQSIFDTLLTTGQKEEIIRQKLIDAGYSQERTINGKVVKAVDWNKVIGSAKNIKEAKAAIVKSITDLGYTQEEAANEINSILNDFDNKVIDRKTRAINSYLNKGVINKVKTALGLKGKGKIQKLIDMNNKGILDDSRVKDVLAQDLGIISLTDADLAKVRELSEKIDKATVPFIRKKYEEQLQYLFDSKGGNLTYLENREFVMNNRLTSLWNQVQNISGYFRIIGTYISISIKTGSPIQTAKVFKKQWQDGVSDALTVLMGGHVSRGTAFSDLTRSTEGEARVRYLEQGKGKLLGLPDLYLRVGNKSVQVNPINALYRKIKYVGRLMEAADTIPSNVISGITQYWQIKKQLELLNPELSSEEIEQKTYDTMYSMDIEKANAQALKDLKESGVENPTRYEINRASHEIVERKRNELISKEFYDTVEKLKPIAETKVNQQGNDNPSEEDILKQVYKILGRDEPLDVVARGERQALRETGKKTTPGITSLVLMPIDGVQQKLKEGMLKKHGQAGKAAYNVMDATFNQLLPFANSIGRWIEMGLELTPYGVLKGLGYKVYGEVAKSNDKNKLTPIEINELGDDYIIRGIQGTAQTLLAMFFIGLLKGKGDDEDDDKITGSYQGANYPQQKIKQVGHPQRSLDINGRKFPLDLIGNAAYPLMMYSDFKDRRTDENERHGVLYTTAAMYLTTAAQSAYSRIGQYGNILSYIYSGKEEKYLPKMATIGGQYLGAQFIPFNRFQQEVGELWNPKSNQSITFGENLLQQFSIMGGFNKDHPAFDYRGREYDKGDIWVGSPDGVVKMFTKSKSADNIDKELAEIDFGATDAFRETKDEENYKYTIENKEGKRRFLTNEEYYKFRRETGKQFNSKLAKNFDIIKNLTIRDKPTSDGKAGQINEEETNAAKREAFSNLLTKSKENALALIQSQTGNVVNPIIEKIEKRQENKFILMQKKIQLQGVDNK